MVEASKRILGTRPLINDLEEKLKLKYLFQSFCIERNLPEKSQDAFGAINLTDVLENVPRAREIFGIIKN